jgi:hypothetical protein
MREENLRMSLNTVVIADDMLYGAAAIAEFLGIPLRRAFYLLEQRPIPAGKLGREYVASRTALRAHLATLAGGDRADDPIAADGPTGKSHSHRLS